MKKLILPVRGMHCRSCELILEKSVRKVPHVDAVNADFSKGTIEISHQNAAPDLQKIELLIEEHGYFIGETKKRPWFSSDISVYNGFIASLMVVAIAYALSNGNVGGFDSLVGSVSPSAGTALLIGLVAGVSSCMALVGGLVLAASAKWNEEHLQKSRWHRFQPHLYFNLWRIIGFGFFGAILGFFGSFLRISSSLQGSMMIVVGMVMLFLWLSLTELSPRLGGMSFSLPKFLSSRSNSNSVRSPVFSSVLSGFGTFFLPCGFTFAMQMYAIGTGSMITGAIAMSLFAVGTAAGLLGIGALTSLLKGVWGKRFFRFTGTVVLILAAYNFSNGWNIIADVIPKQTVAAAQSKTETPPVVVKPERQTEEITMTQDGSGYTPNQLTIHHGNKIRWKINSTSSFTCASSLIVPSLGIQKYLSKGENIIEFDAPDIPGELAFSCSMGMYRGKITVE